jgi:glycosyltransferase involved in cell wall biosynthesis
LGFTKSYGNDVSSNKKILYLRTDIYNKELISGGSVSHTSGVINGFLKLDYDVFCASSLMVPIIKNLEIKKFVRLKNPSCLNFLRWKINCIFSNFFFTYLLLKKIKQWDFEFIYQRYSLLNFTGIILSKIKKKKIILEYNGSEYWVEKNWGGIKLKSLIFSFPSIVIEKINIKYSDKIIVVSDVLKEELLKRGVTKERILVNPNGVNPIEYNPEKLEEHRFKIRKKLGLENIFVFGFIGTFSYWHGINILEKLIPKVVKNNKKIKFLMIGDGPLLESLKESLEKYKSKIVFTGLTTHEEGKRYLSACDAFLCPTQQNSDGSAFFGSPTKLFEYMSLSRPVISSGIEQLKEIISPALMVRDLSAKTVVKNEVGILADWDNDEEFLRACMWVLFNKNILNRLGKNAREKILKYYTWQMHVKKIEEFVNNKIS